MRPVLDVDLAGISLRSPVLAASGCFRAPKDVHGLVDPRKLGGIVTPSVTLDPVSGAPAPRAAETSAGLLTATGWQNPGLEAFVREQLPPLLRTGTPVIASVAGESPDEFVQVAAVLSQIEGVVAVEVNLACRSAERGGAVFAHRADHAAEVVGAVSRTARIPVFAKLSADVPHIADIAGSCVQAGAHGLTLIHGVPGMSVSVRTGLPRLGAVEGRVSGPAIRPLAVRAVFEVAMAMPEVPIMGVGGVMDGSSAVEFLRAGAWAVQVGTAMLVHPDAPVEIAKGILGHLRAARVGRADDLRKVLVAPPDAQTSADDGS